MTGGSCGEVVRSILRSHCDGSQGDIDYVEVFLVFLSVLFLNVRFYFYVGQINTHYYRRVAFSMLSQAFAMCTPALQNDFSHYRRGIGLGLLERSAAEVELANSISLFLATPTPMLSSLTSATLEFVQSHPMLPIGNTTDTLATIVSVCRYMVASPEVSARVTETTRLFCIRVMVGCLILYDHIDESGAFVRESPINLRAVVNVVKEQTQPPQTEALLNALRYTSKHFSQASTPKSVRAILA
uniref:CYRIA-B_Rac1-bd domain-containing protein n=1 Tax=Angiostrongylus cantonensis TaxID=6313 RepID=A0A0K0DJ88_ANGCA